MMPYLSLAEKLRPQKVGDIVGQESLLGEGKPLRRFLDARKIPSLIFWGPPGCGKTTLARLLAEEVGFKFEAISATSGGVTELRKVFEQADGKTLLFVDEIHRLNRSQQDVLLSPIETGLITLVGATTENPSFSLNAALLSRCHVFVLERLGEEALLSLIKRAEQYIEKELPLTQEAKKTLVRMADGDGRYLLNLLEATLSSVVPLDSNHLEDFLQKRAPLYDKGQEAHYNLISALHKAVRGSDPDAALYWFCRMVEGGEDLIFIARRLIRMASEDIGLADPRALEHVVAAKKAYESLGSPEGELALAQSIIYLTLAPKSNAVYLAYKKALRFAQTTGSYMPPKHILNAPTALMKGLGYGKGYIYDHDTEEGISGQNYFPEGLKQQTFYTPKGRGVEQRIVERLKEIKAIKSRNHL